MNELIQWLNSNSGFVMVVLTFAYVVATIFICIYNSKSAKAVNKQTQESYKQFIENSRAHVIPKIIEVEGEIVCLCFQNVGRDIASDVIIKINEKWLKLLEQTHTFPEVANSLRVVKKKKMFLTVDQSIVYGLCIPGNGYEDFKQLTKENLKINIKYKTLGNEYSEDYEIPLDGYNGLVNMSDYARMTKKQIKETHEINKSLKVLNSTLKDFQK